MAAKWYLVWPRERDARLRVLVGCEDAKAEGAEEEAVERGAFHKHQRSRGGLIISNREASGINYFFY